MCFESRIICFVLLIVFLFHRIQAVWSFHHKKAEQLTLGEMVLLVKDGVMNIREMGR
jgi:uncharacterized membrane protein YcaP (DUF421 family)